MAWPCLNPKAEDPSGPESLGREQVLLSSRPFCSGPRLGGLGPPALRPCTSSGLTGPPPAEPSRTPRSRST